MPFFTFNGLFDSKKLTTTARPPIFSLRMTFSLEIEGTDDVLGISTGLGTLRINL